MAGHGDDDENGNFRGGGGVTMPMPGVRHRGMRWDGHGDDDENGNDRRGGGDDADAPAAPGSRASSVGVRLDVDVVDTYRALAERCARDVTRGGYPCELLDLRMTNCVNDDADDYGRGGLGLQENVARMERDQKSEFRMLARGGRVRRGGPRRRPVAAAAAAEGGGVMFRGGR